MQMTEEQERHVRRIGRTCRGPAVLTADRRRAELRAARDAADAGDAAAVLAVADRVQAEIAAIARENRWPPPPAAARTADPAAALLEALRVIGAHTEACGADVNGLIVAAGADGDEHSAPCPRCGTALTWRAPRF